MTPKIFAAGDAIPEQSTAQYACTFIDHLTGAAINAAAVTAITATLRAYGGDVINSRTAQSVLNVNGGTLAVDGTFALVLSSLDTVAVGTMAIQQRVLTLEVDFTSGKLTHEVIFFVRQLDDVS
jgi:hypothetical protein